MREQSRTFRLSVALAVLSVVAAPIILTVVTYGWFKDRAVAETGRRALPPYVANAVKHVFAAAEVYATLRSAGIAQEHASRIVYRLGQLNEYAEYYGRRSAKRDPTQEIYKDLYNNLLGVAAAAALERGISRVSSADLLSLIGRLAADGKLMPTFLDVRIPSFHFGTDPLASDLHAALVAFSGDKARLAVMMLADLKEN